MSPYLSHNVRTEESDVEVVEVITDEPDVFLHARNLVGDSSQRGRDRVAVRG